MGESEIPENAGVRANSDDANGERDKGLVFETNDHRDDSEGNAEDMNDDGAFERPGTQLP